MTRTIDLPLLRATGCAAVFLERAELAGSPTWVVSVRPDLGTAVSRRWYPDEPSALAYAAEQADRHGLLLIDLREPED